MNAIQVHAELKHPVVEILQKLSEHLLAHCHHLFKKKIEEVRAADSLLMQRNSIRQKVVIHFLYLILKLDIRAGMSVRQP
jgi:hypothetical protein